MKRYILTVGTIVILSGILISLTGCNSDNNRVDNNVDENSIVQENEATTKSTNIKLDARYTSKTSKEIAIDLYSDNTIYYAYVPRTGNSEYYTGTFKINGNQITLNLVPDDSEKNQIMNQGNPKIFTIISNEEFKDENDNIYKYSCDYKKGLLPNEQ